MDRRRAVPGGRTVAAAGTRLQSGGVAASLRAPVGSAPGGVGNFQVTGHLCDSCDRDALSRLPSLRVGQRAVVEADGVRYVYEIRGTRQTSFRSSRSLAEQRAPRAVQEHGQERSLQAFLTLSTCATPEDHAAGNYWADRFDNPVAPHRQVGVLVRTVHAG